MCQKVTLVNSLIVVSSIIAVYFLVGYVYIESYVWQCTHLASVISPVIRPSCLINQAMISEDNSMKKLKIGILMMYDNKDGNWNNELMDRVLKNRENYAQRHGYTIINANNMIDKSRPPAWTKLIAMEKHLASNQFDYLMYMDMDVVIMNPLLRLESFIAPGFDFVMTEDWGGLNSGNWLAKNTDFSKWFLRTAWEQKHLVERTSSEGVKYPFEYEQRAFHFLTNSKVWQDRKLPKYRGEKSPEEIMEHFYVMPQCAFNSYVVHPLESRADREVSQYVDGDLLVHFAGKKGQMKTDLMEYYLDLAELRHE